MNPILQLHEEKMTKTISVLREELAAIRAGRANPAVLDKLVVDYYGAPTKINQLAAVSVSEARTLVIQPYDKSTLKSIEKPSRLPISASTPTMTAPFCVCCSLR